MLLVAFLLAGTAVAFAVTQGLKQERSPVYGVRFDRVLGPHHPAHLRFKLRKRQKITVTVVDGNGHTVDTLLDNKPEHGMVKVHWNGQRHVGLGAQSYSSPGSYRLRVHLSRSGATITIPTVFRYDPAPPTLAHVSVRPRVLTRGRRVVIRYVTNEAGQVILRVDGNRAVVTRP